MMRSLDPLSSLVTWLFSNRGALFRSADLSDCRTLNAYLNLPQAFLNVLNRLGTVIGKMFDM